MFIVTSSLRRPVAIVVATVGLALACWLAVERMPRDVFPSLKIPTIYVAQPYGGMDPAQMEGFLTYYYEYHFLYITGIEHVESKSIQGASLMKLQFHPGTDMSQAMSEVIGYVNRSRAFMPPGTVPPFVMRFDAGSVPVGNLVFSSATKTVAQLQDAALNMVRPLFATLPGVSAPPPFGGSARTILINLKPDRLRSYGMAPDEIAVAMTTANLISPSGNVVIGDTYPQVPVNSTVKNIRDLESLPIRTGQYPAVFVRDVAEVTDGADLVTSYALVNGKRTVYIPVTKRADASTLSVVNLVKQNIPRFQAAVPGDVKVSYEFDQSPLVVRAIRDLIKEGALGAGLTGLMVLLFLRDFRSTLIVVINIPLALASAVFGLWLCGQTINLMTLGGLALAVGILVDEATVAIENIHHELAGGLGTARAVRKAIVDTAVPRLLAMLCVIAVFIPSFLMEGAGKALFVPISLAVGFSMFASWVLSNTLLPVLSIWLLGKKHAAGEGFIFRLVKKTYGGIVWAAVKSRFIFAPAAIAGCVLAAMSFYPFLGTEIFPTVDNGQIKLRIRATPGTKLDKTEAISLKALDIMQDVLGRENVSLTMGLVGVHAPNYPINLIYEFNGGTDEAMVQAQMKPGTGVDLEEAKEKMRERLKKELPEARFSFEPADIVSRVMSFGANTPIEVAVSGPTLSDNKAFADKIKAELEKVKGLRDLQFTQTLDYPTLDVTVNRERAGLQGVKMADAARSVAEATSSTRFFLPNYWADGKSGVAYNLQVQVPLTATKSVEDLRNIPVALKDGQPVLLRNIATVKEGAAVAQYERYNMQRLVTLTANYTGTDLGSIAGAVGKAVKAAGEAPPKVKVDVRGQVQPMMQLLDNLETGLILSIVVIALLLAAYFQSVRLSLVVAATVPAVVCGVTLALLFTGTTINIQSFIGSIMAVGVAVANSILLVTFAERYRFEGMKPVAAAIEAAKTRLRPILMTSFAMIAGMIPMALGLGESGAQTAPLGRAVVGGLALGTVATLLIVPAVFALLMMGKVKKTASIDPDDPASVHYDLGNTYENRTA